jgi:hypothetical protein
MASDGEHSERRRSYRDFHAERVRQRLLWRAILLVVFVLAGAAVLAVISLSGR